MITETATIAIGRIAQVGFERAEISREQFKG
jgi:hypothetical protein